MDAFKVTENMREIWQWKFCHLLHSFGVFVMYPYSHGILFPVILNP